MITERIETAISRFKTMVILDMALQIMSHKTLKKSVMIPLENKFYVTEAIVNVGENAEDAEILFRITDGITDSDMVKSAKDMSVEELIKIATEL